MAEGRLDTNIVVHALKNDRHSEECRVFLESVRNGHRTVRLEAYVVHELCYVISRVEKQMSRADAANFLLNLVQWPGIDCDRAVLQDALTRWGSGSNVSFVDALLAAEALRDGTKIFTKNVRDFTGIGIDVPDPLPS